jgi:GTP:adenosylcobinamide-phosphate guanylyltransferase
VGTPAIIAAGDRRAAKGIYGQSKVYLEVAGLPLVARVALVLQRVPEISEVWVVGDAERLEAVFSRQDVRPKLAKPLHVVPQFRNLYENVWETFKRTLPGAGPEGREPEGEDLDWQALMLSADLPFATPQEISEFVRRGWETGCDYVAGAVTDESLQAFRPQQGGGVGIEVAYFNVREARLRQSNLHLARPARMGMRQLIEDMYEHRHQRQFWNMLAVGWRVLAVTRGGFSVLLLYGLMHLAGFVDRWGLRSVADWLRIPVTLERTEKIVARLLQTTFQFVITEAGGCAIDVDDEHEYDVVRARFEEWREAQEARAEELYGPLPLPPVAGTGGSENAVTRGGCAG